jgi:hypothetical protein
LRGLSCRAQRQRSRDIWPRRLRSLMWEPVFRPGGFLARPMDLGANARYDSFAARSLHCGLRPPVEMTTRAHELIRIRIITRYRKANTNLRKRLERTVKRAGLQPWPRLFQNLRSSRETEFAQSYPLHVVSSLQAAARQVGGRKWVSSPVCLQVTVRLILVAVLGVSGEVYFLRSWTGNSKAIAAKHYLQVRDEEFEQATPCPTGAAQSPPQQTAEGEGDGLQPTCVAEHTNRICEVETAVCECSQVLAGQRFGDEGNRTLIPAMRPPCAPVTPRPQDA